MGSQGPTVSPTNGRRGVRHLGLLPVYASLAADYTKPNDADTARTYLTARRSRLPGASRKRLRCLCPGPRSRAYEHNWSDQDHP
jgi:hypothetical protein